jgi:hypothetical protein
MPRKGRSVTGTTPVDTHDPASSAWRAERAGDAQVFSASAGWHDRLHVKR